MLKLLENKISKEDKYKEIPCRYSTTWKGCRRGKKCWFSHESGTESSRKTKQEINTKVKVKPNKWREKNDKDAKEEHDAGL